MKVNGIDHICIAVKNLEEAKKIWEPLLGKVKPDEEYIHEAEKIKVARYYLDRIGFELMESTAPDGDVARFIEKRGEGIMLIALNVDNIQETSAELQASGYPLTGAARPFRNGHYLFVHPKATNGVLLEYINDKTGSRERLNGS